MGDGVKLKYHDLEALQIQLGNIIEEFEAAGARRSDLSSAIGRPFGEGALQDSADSFEERWDDKRRVLMDNCKKLSEYLGGVITGFSDFDLEAAKAASGEETS